jgi:hypothetical protein
LDLSNMGLATWKGAASETGVTGYTVTLYKTGTPNTLIDTQSVIKGAAYSVDFLAAMRTAGAGDYGFTITTVGDGTTLLDSNETALSNTQTVSQLGSHLPQWLWWDGVNAKWKDVNTDLSNISKYSVQLYKDGTAVGNAVEVEMSTGIIDTDGGNNGKAFANNFASSMITAGSYTFKVKAIGIGLHLDSAEKPSSSVTVAHRPKVAYAWWLNADTARWVNPDGNGNYTVQLYKNGVAVGSPVSVTRQSTTNPSNAAETVTDHNFSAAKLGVGDIGWYTFTVTAKGDGALKLDATETSDMSGKTGFSPFGTSRPWAIVEGGGKIVAGADGGKIAYSTNGTHWVLSMQTVFGVNEAVRGIAYSSALGSGNGRFVAVGYNGKAAYSDDGGVTWTAATTGLSSSLLTVAYGNNKFIAGGDGGEVRASVDGMNWTGITGWDVSSILDHETVMTLVYANGNFVAAGNKGKVAYSADGSKNWNWSQDVAGTTDPNRKGMLSIAYNSSGVFVAAMKTNTHLVYSKNPCVSGAAWSWVEHHVGADIEAAAFGNGKFIVVGAGGKASTSSDGATWGAMTVGDDATDKTQFNTGEAIRTVGFTGSQFILAGEGKFAAITP